MSSHTWHLDTGSVRVTSAMAWPQTDDCQQLLFRVEALGGEAEIEIAFDPRPDWGRTDAALRSLEDGAYLVAEALHVLCEVPEQFTVAEGRVRSTLRLTRGEAMTVRLAAARGGVPRLGSGALETMEATRSAWHDWVAAISYDGLCRSDVIRSAITLKLLIFEPTGAVVAAGTTSLPEVIGGVRNWDYRYTWLRDASFTLNSLFALGCRREAIAYARWLGDVVADAPLPMNVLYRIDGGSGLAEARVYDVDGYRGSRPVRIGNAAAGQLQLDTYGELLDCITICEVMDEQTLRDAWPDFRRLIEFVADHWREPDSGIWEVRDRPRHFVHSKAQAWVAFDRGCWLVDTFGLDGHTERWREEAAKLRGEVAARGRIPGGGFARSYGSSDVDAALLTLPTLGYIDGGDRRMLATIDAVREQLSMDGAVDPALILRYPHRAGDGLPGEEGAFTLCSFWLVEAFAHAGRHNDADQHFRALCDLRGDSGLFAEEIDPHSGDQLGNLPQAFTHIGLINAALRLIDAIPPRPTSLRGAQP